MSLASLIASLLFWIIVPILSFLFCAVGIGAASNYLWDDSTAHLAWELLHDSQMLAAGRVGQRGASSSTVTNRRRAVGEDTDPVPWQRRWQRRCYHPYVLRVWALVSTLGLVSLGGWWYKQPSGQVAELHHGAALSPLNSDKTADSPVPQPPALSLTGLLFTKLRELGVAAAIWTWHAVWSAGKQLTVAISDSAVRIARDVQSPGAAGGFADSVRTFRSSYGEPVFIAAATVAACIALVVVLAACTGGRRAWRSIAQRRLTNRVVGELQHMCAVRLADDAHDALVVARMLGLDPAALWPNGYWWQRLRRRGVARGRTRRRGKLGDTALAAAAGSVSNTAWIASRDPRANEYVEVTSDEDHDGNTAGSTRRPHRRGDAADDDDDDRVADEDFDDDNGSEEASSGISEAVSKKGVTTHAAAASNAAAPSMLQAQAGMPIPVAPSNTSAAISGSAAGTSAYLPSGAPSASPRMADPLMDAAAAASSGLTLAQRLLMQRRQARAQAAGTASGSTLDGIGAAMAGDMHQHGASGSSSGLFLSPSSGARFTGTGAAASLSHSGGLLPPQFSVTGSESGSATAPAAYLTAEAGPRSPQSAATGSAASGTTASAEFAASLERARADAAVTRAAARLQARLALAQDIAAAAGVDLAALQVAGVPLPLGVEAHQQAPELQQHEH